MDLVIKSRVDEFSSSFLHHVLSTTHFFTPSPIFPFHLLTPDPFSLKIPSQLFRRSLRIPNNRALLPAILSLRITSLPARLLRLINTLALALARLITNLSALALLGVTRDRAVSSFRITDLPAITPLHLLVHLLLLLPLTHQLAIRAILIAPRPALARLADQRAPRGNTLPHATAQRDAHLGAVVVEPLVARVLAVAVDVRLRHADERAFVDVAAEATFGWVVAPS